jgi:hypothetical protein
MAIAMAGKFLVIQQMLLQKALAHSKDKKTVFLPDKKKNG